MTLNLLEIESVLEVRALKVVALIVDYDGVVGVSPPSIEHCALQRGTILRGFGVGNTVAGSHQQTLLVAEVGLVNADLVLLPL